MGRRDANSSKASRALLGGPPDFDLPQRRRCVLPPEFDHQFEPVKLCDRSGLLH